jgi:hypothetical protein
MARNPRAARAATSLFRGERPGYLAPMHTIERTVLEVPTPAAPDQPMPDPPSGPAVPDGPPTEDPAVPPGPEMPESRPANEPEPVGPDVPSADPKGPETPGD